jgi:hypothetical protein
MLTMRRLLVAGLAAGMIAAGLAGCGGRPLRDLSTVDPQPLAAPTSGSPGGASGDAPPSVFPGDSAPADAPTTVPPTVVPANFQGACSLVHKADLVALTKGSGVTLDFPVDPTEETNVDVLTGPASRCSWPLRSTFRDKTGYSIGSGSVTVKIWSIGARDYFPVRAPDVPVSGVGAEAMLRNSTMYVRVGDGLLMLEVGIGNPAPDPHALDIAWTKELATIVLARIKTHYR